MSSLSEFRKMLPPEAQHYSDEELQNIDTLLEKLADILFTVWITERNKDSNSQVLDEESVP